MIYSWVSTEIFPEGGNIDILPIVLTLLMMQCKWMFTNHSTLSAPQKIPRVMAAKNARHLQQTPSILR